MVTSNYIAVYTGYALVKLLTKDKFLALVIKMKFINY